MTEAAARLSLAVGDRVVYPNQGVCRVTAVEAKEVAGQRLTFVTLRREEDSAVVMVPEAKVVSIGLRKVASPEQVQEIFEFLRSDSDKANLDWKQRARTNLDRMSQGGLLGLAEVVKGLQVLSELRPLPAKERELYDDARHLLVEEIAASLKIDPSDAEDSVDLILFPPGRERPKRTAEEFRSASLEDLDLDESLLEVGAELDLPSEDGDESEGDEPDDSVETTDVDGQPVDSEGTPTRPSAPSALAIADAPAKRKRGRPRKVAAAADDEVTEPAVPPKKRGRPPKPKAAEPPAPPKKRGRPPKSRAAPAAKSAKANKASENSPSKWAKAAARTPSTRKKK